MFQAEVNAKRFGKTESNLLGCMWEAGKINSWKKSLQRSLLSAAYMDQKENQEWMGRQGSGDTEYRLLFHRLAAIVQGSVW